MDAESVQQLLQSFKEMAQANRELAAAATAAATNAAPTTNNVAPAETPTPNDAGARAVALTSIKVPCDMGRDAEERLVNFHNWKEEVADKLEVAGVKDEKRQTTIALMWGGRDIKRFATEKAGINLHDTTDVPADG